MSEHNMQEFNKLNSFLARLWIEHRREEILAAFKKIGGFERDPNLCILEDLNSPKIERVNK